MVKMRIVVVKPDVVYLFRRAVVFQRFWGPTMLHSTIDVIKN